LGGLLATEILLEKPGLFNQYIIVSPSLWWDNESLLARAPELLSKTADPKIKIYLSIGNEGQMEENDAKNLLKVLHDARKNWETYFMPLPEETHLTILHNSVYKAFQILYPKKDTTKK
jgi:predicted alpha/beta superfamily hydrolase